MTDEELSKCLEIEADRDYLKIEIERLRARGDYQRELVDRLNEAAAFLDGLAGSLEERLSDIGYTVAAAECRAMAEKLRGDIHDQSATTMKGPTTHE